MSEGQPHVLDYLDYKNKLRTLEWEERVWRLHLSGGLPDPRADEDRRRYCGLMARLQQARTLAEELHSRRGLVGQFTRVVPAN
jgi:hypothetical protein